MRIVGIDFSLSCPAVCIHEGQDWSIDNCQFLFMSSYKKLDGSWGRVKGSLFKDYSTDIERFLLNAHDLKKFVAPDQTTQIAIEGYSFGSNGSRLFQIAEATGILKTLLIHDSGGNLINQGRNLTPFAPSAVKKFATTKGNADKQMMYDAFVADTKLELINLLGLKRLDSPCHDLADSYFIAKMRFQQLKGTI